MQQNNQPRATLTAEQRADLEALLRNQIACVRATCRLLGRPAPLISRDDQRHERVSLPNP
jgi:IS30 family transposase